MNILNYIAKLLANLGLLATLVYVFIFYIHLNDWLDWVWFICLCLLGILGIYGNCAVFSEDEESDQKIILSCVGVIDFIICGSILLKIFNNSIDDISFVALPMALFVFVAGINRVTMCMLFIIINVFMICNSIQIFHWHSISLLVSTIILQAGMTINSIIDRSGNDAKTGLNEFLGAIVSSASIGYLIYFDLIEHTTTNSLLFLLAYLIIAFSSSIQNNLKLYAIMPSVIVAYAIFFIFEWHNVFSWVILAIVCFYSLAINICIKGLCNQLKLICQCAGILVSENEKIINRHNELVNEHNKLVKAINSAIEDSNIDKPIDKSTGNSGFLDTVGKGFFREAGKALFKILTGQ